MAMTRTGRSAVRLLVITHYFSGEKLWQDIVMKIRKHLLARIE